MNRVFKALSDPTRRQVLQLLRSGPMTAGELADEFDLAKPTMSRHFATKGTTITYRLRLSVLEDALLGFAEMFGVEPEPAREQPGTGKRMANGVKP